MNTYPPKIDFPVNSFKWHDVADPIFYKDILDFKNKNPNCCQIAFEIPGAEYRFGKGYGAVFAVSVKYDVVFQGGASTRHVDESKFISACGSPVYYGFE